MKNNTFIRLLIAHLFELLLRKMNGLNLFNMDDIFHIFITSRNTEILIDSNYWLGMYVP